MIFEFIFGLDVGLAILLIFCILAACSFEFINGFHDTANAVATVIYTHSLKPRVAVILSGVLNFLGVLTGGIAVAMSIVNLLPMEVLVDQDVHHSVGMVLALLLTAIIWNLGTWYLGIPCSSSHTMIGSILGVGIAYSFLPNTDAAVNWSKAIDIGLSLLISPFIGFMLTLLLMFLLKKIIKDQKIFQEPSKTHAPPWWIRTILITTCSGVSYSHGSNDGQKGVGLMMLILISIVPIHFALQNPSNPSKMKGQVYTIEQIVNKIDVNALSEKEAKNIDKVKVEIAELNALLLESEKEGKIADEKRFAVRRDIMLITHTLGKLLASNELMLNKQDAKNLQEAISEKGLRSNTDYAPSWVLLIISISLGIGTTVGWKRIVETIGEKIGKTHLTYAQGASAEVVAMSTIGLANTFGLPVSTTQVLSSGIAGTMVASDGLKNLQPGTIKSMIIAWVLTLPVCICLSAGLFLLFRWLF